MSHILQGDDLETKQRRVELEQEGQARPASADGRAPATAKRPRPDALDAKGLASVKRSHTLPKGARGAYSRAAA